MRLVEKVHMGHKMHSPGVYTGQTLYSGYRVTVYCEEWKYVFCNCIYKDTRRSQKWWQRYVRSLILLDS